MDLSHIAFFLFAAFSALRMVSYLPQIYRVARDTNGATAISYSTWGLWTGANVATALYACVNLHDLYLASVSVVYATCCIAVIVLTLIKRRRHFGGSPAGETPSTRPLRTLRLQLPGSAGPRLGLLAGSLAAIVIGLSLAWGLTGTTAARTSMPRDAESLAASTNADDAPSVTATSEVVPKPAEATRATQAGEADSRCPPAPRKGSTKAKRAKCGSATASP
jgi:hypothetical protein